VLRPVPAGARSTSRLGAYLDRLEARTGRSFGDVHELWQWSVDDLDGFWASIAEHFGVRFRDAPARVLADDRMPGAVWFPGATLNYAEHALGTLTSPFAPQPRPDDAVAVIGRSQTRDDVTLTWSELRDQVARARAGLRRLGVRRGDRVAAYLPNVPETVVAFLATASIGAVWASCAPEFGARSVADRFAQIEPTVLLAAPGYVYGAKPIDRRAATAELLARLPTVRHLIEIPYGAGHLAGALPWPELLAGAPDADVEPVPFDHPLVVLFSSGTTGLPKPIVHGHGGILLEHLKNHALSFDLGPGDRMLWFTTTAWMMWNSLVSGLLVQATIVTVDGNPLHPGPAAQWALAEETGATLLGLSPGFVMACRKAGMQPGRDFDLSAVRQVGAAGSPLPVEGFVWLTEQLGDDVLVNVGSGGTDVCSGIVQGSPLHPVYAGEIAGPCLGVAAYAYDARHRPVVGELGELVITRPMPSMPVGFWGDDDDSRYRAAYFADIPGVWRHGDWVRFSEAGSCVVAGRSDATLNRGGVRLGTADFYAVVEELPEIGDSLVVHLEDPAGGPGQLILFVVPAAGATLDEALRGRIVQALREQLSPRHVPDAVVGVPAVPRGRTGKKLELPVKRILLGEDPASVASAGALSDPSALTHYGPWRDEP
jgi:acetoacetyl-CoA synthetase